ncbi:SpaH/EbpB family LPXTG-anchored major pilin [Corynebacterium kozikiae]|uniref:SpaH/EbpB family LPXTG-anchored major pilin n=1 Tax=Corynebacterium kozikiae TaxID=2968469 RepID=UPI00211BEA4A|nr:SpaH/EbpB family LPXTG-anchored major pilin [Corynebacterium sp. 76QC2CO]MCQ9343740.1 SpaH/EbpB family LPXTG-anchored major pilin [Corynebacterium sp. 76QC2CO]
MTNRSLKVRSVASAAILGVALSTAAIGAPDAFAQTAGQAANTASANDSTITQSTGTLTIHKKGDPTTTGTPTGNIDPNVTGEDLANVGFTVTQVTGIDLKTNAGLAAAANLTVAQAQAQRGTARTEITNTSGTAVFDNLPVGVYLVEETTPAPGYTPAAPFLAFVPMTQGNAGAQGTTWNYDVHAYPKNYEKTQPVKTVVDNNQNIGDTIEYNINTVVRTIAEGKRLAYYFISDTLDVANLDVPNAEIAVSIDDATAIEGVDYTLTKDDATGHVLVRFTADGLKKLKTGTKVNVNIKATKITNGEVLPNTAIEYEPSKPEFDQDVDSDEEPPTTPPTTPPNNPPSVYETPIVVTYFSEVEFKKVDANRAALQGAEFQLLRTAAGDKTCEDSMDAEKGQGSYLVNGSLNDNPTPVQTFVSNQEGLVNISGLHVTDFADNADVPEGEQTVYCLYETKAPAGKELLSKPLSFTLVKDPTQTRTITRNVVVYKTDAQGNTTQETEQRTHTVAVYNPVFLQVGDNAGEVVNLDDTTPNLPLTGGLGVGILAAIGAGIVAAGAYFARRSAQQS